MADYAVEEKNAVEAALFAASEPLTIQDIAERTGIDVAVIRYAVKDLHKEYDDRGSAIVISAIDGRYRMQLRAEFQQYTDVAAIPEFPPGVMRTLSAIAYNQPVSQAKVVKARGPRGYSDVNILVEAGYVYSKPKGNSFELTTTKKFAEDFGVGSTRIDDIKAWIERNSKGDVVRKKYAQISEESSDGTQGGESSDDPQGTEGQQ